MENYYLCRGRNSGGRRNLFLSSSKYESQAKLFVRYVVDRSAVDGLDSQTKTETLGSPSESAINSEVEILTSSDLAMQVAASVGADRLLPGSGEKPRMQTPLCLS